MLPFSYSDVAASVAVLLGVVPQVAVSQLSASKVIFQAKATVNLNALRSRSEDTTMTNMLIGANLGSIWRFSCRPLQWNMLREGICLVVGNFNVISSCRWIIKKWVLLQISCARYHSMFQAEGAWGIIEADASDIWLLFVWQLDSLVSPDPFHRPGAVLSLNIGGVEPGEFVHVVL